MKRILVCEDEESIREFEVLSLTNKGFDVTAVGSGEDALRVFEKENGNFDIVLLDVMLPGIDGFTVCQKLREKSKVGIIMLTAKSQDIDQERGWLARADDYIIKPFKPSDLANRVEALYRRVSTYAANSESSTVLESGPFVINLNARTVTKNGEPKDLTDVEYKILVYFLRNKNTALDRASILQHIWGENYPGENKIVDVNIRRLRMKIEDDPSDPRYIRTIWGYGYKWDDKPEGRH